MTHVVASAAPERRFFHYQISRSEADVRRGAKSRYYPVELSGVLQSIRGAPGRYAVVGVPCFIKALNLLRAADAVLRERVVFTLGLYCGHMKSARMIESFACQMGADIGAIESVDFRLKNPDRPANLYTAHLTLGDGQCRSKDWWSLVEGDWGSGFFQNSACNFCDDVVAETADIAFGDAWVEPYSSDGRGTNVVIVRSPILYNLLCDAIADGRLALRPVDGDFVARTQAAGFRQRREGLAYRLTWPRFGISPRKRVAPSRNLPVRRMAIYTMRVFISASSHQMFALARLARALRLYVSWGRLVVTIYHALAYSRGPLGKVIDRLGAFAGNLAPEFGGSAERYRTVVAKNRPCAGTKRPPRP